MSNKVIARYTKNNVGKVDIRGVLESVLPEGQTLETFNNAAQLTDYMREHAQVAIQQNILDHYKASGNPASVSTEAYSLGGSTTGQVYMEEGKMFSKVETVYKSEAMKALRSNIDALALPATIDEDVI